MPSVWRDGSGAGMKEFTCGCGWKYIVGKRRVYGPLYEKSATHRMMTIEDWRLQYGDCWAAYNRVPMVHESAVKP